MKTKIYIVTLTNEDSWVSIVGVYKSLEVAQQSMKYDWSEHVSEIEHEGFVPVMKRDQFSAVIKYGNEHFYLYQIHEEEILHPATKVAETEDLPA